MKKNIKQGCKRVNPEETICPIYDQTGIRMFSVAAPEEMGMRVVDDCAEDHIM